MSVAVAQQPVAVPNKKTIAFEPPTTWRVVPLYHLFNSVGGATPSKDKDDYWKGDIPWVSPKDMKSSVVYDSIDHISQSALSETRLSLLPVGTVLIVVRGMILAHSIPVATTSAKVTINQDMKGLSAKAGVRPDFLAYLLRAISPLLFSTIEESGHGTRCLRLDLWRNILVGVPLEDEQDRILSFIDRKTAQIDAVVAKKQRLIERLQEKRQALISHAVTKGLDPHAPMKDSGIEWLGQIPAHWSVSPLKRFWNVTDCKHLTVPFVDDGIPVASIGEVQDLTVNLTAANKTVRADYLHLIDGGRKPAVGDVIYSRNATVGAAALVNTDEEFCMGQDVCLISSVGENQEFLLFQLRSPIVMRQLDALMVGATFKRINVGQIKELLVCRPPEAEQAVIASHCWKVHKSLMNAADRLATQIAKLQEYRQTLISAAVTGKIDVAKEAAS